MFAAGSVIGLSVGGIIIQDYGWRMTFFMIIPISLVLLFIIRKYIHVDDEFHHENQPKKLENIPLNIEGEESTNKEFLDTNLTRKNDEKDSNVKYIKKRVSIDIKGAITLATTIISFLLALTFLDSNTQVNSYSISNYYSIFFQILPFVIIGILSLIIFIIIEKKTPFPLINFKIFDTTILFSCLVIMIAGMSMFMVFQTIPILIETPKPIGFGEDSIATGQIILPFSIVLLIFGPASGFIISKLGTVKPLILGSVFTTLGFVGLFLFHSNVIYISANLALLSAGLSFASVSAMNIIILAAHRDYSVVTIGVSSLLRIIGSSIGPALAALYMEINQMSLKINGIETYFPSPVAFDMIFFSAIILSFSAIVLSILLSRKILKMSVPNLT
jgi:MFS family permease